jgi:hypothetical protein
MLSRSHPWTPTRLKASATATAVEALFGGVWAIAGASLLNGSVEVAAILLGVVATAALLFASVRLRRSAPDHVDAAPERVDGVAEAQKGLRGVVVIEAVMVVVVIRLLVMADLQPYVAAAIAVVVGLHFLPLARLFRTPTHYFTAVLLIVAGLGGTVGLSMGVGSGSSRAWDAGVDFFSAVVLWCSAFLILVRTRNASRVMAGMVHER